MQRWNSKREMMGDDPPYLAVGTEVSAKYKGAFCEAKVRKVVRSVKCKVAFKLGLGTATITDDQIRGTLRAGVTVEAKHPEKKEYSEATITKIQDCSQYTVVFDDGDITTLRRTALCLKSGRHFAESETLDQLPLTHPEHFGNPVIGGRRGRRNRQDDSSDDEELVKKGKQRREEKEADIGKVVCVEISEKKKQKDNWFPGLVVAPTAQDTVRIHVREEYLVRSFKDGRYYTVPKKEATPFTREIGLKVDNNTLRTAVEKALLFLDRDELPPHWDRELLFGLDETSNSDSDGAFDSDSSDDEPREEKDHFVAQLYKFMDDRGTPINKGPTIATKDVDLYKLFKVVHKLGGYNRVTNHNQWKTISHKLGFGQTASTVNLVKHAYKKFLHSFEDFYRKLGCTMVNHPRNNRARHRSNRSLIRDRDRALVNKEKTDGGSSEEVKETPPIDIKKEEPPLKTKEEEKPKETEIQKSLRDSSRKELAVKGKPKDEKLEKKDLNVKEQTATKKSEPEVSNLKNKEATKTDEREDRIKMRDSLKAADAVMNAKADGKQEKELPKGRQKDKDLTHKEKEKESEEKDAQKVNKGKEEGSDSSHQHEPLQNTSSQDIEDVDDFSLNVSTPDIQTSISVKAKSNFPSVTSSTTDSAIAPKNIQLTRSKSKEEPGKIKKVESPVTDVKKPVVVPTCTASSTVPIISSVSALPPTLQSQISETEKKRGRKRKDDERGTSSEEILDQLPSYKSVSVGDKLKVYYGPTHESKVTYEAKVLSAKMEGSETMYLVHYTGWNTRYDEWIKRSRIADNLSWSPGRVKRSRFQTQQLEKSTYDNLLYVQLQMKPSPIGNGSKRGSRGSDGNNVSSSSSMTSSSGSLPCLTAAGAPATTTAPVKRSTTPSSNRAQSLHATRTYTRTTKQRPRRISGHTDFSESESGEYDSESDVEMSSGSGQKRNDKMVCSGEDEKEDCNDNPRTKRRISLLQLGEEKCRESVISTRRKLIPSSTSEDERDGKKFGDKLQDDKVLMERRTVTRSSVEKDMRSHDEINSNVMANSERLRGRKLRSDKANRLLSESEDEKDESLEQVSRKDLRRTLSDRRRNDDNLKIKPIENKKELSADEENYGDDDEGDDESIKALLGEQKVSELNKTGIKPDEIKLDDNSSQDNIQIVGLKVRNDKRKSETQLKSQENVEKDNKTEAVKEEDILPRSDRLRNRMEKKKSFEMKTLTTHVVASPHSEDVSDEFVDVKPNKTDASKMVPDQSSSISFCEDEDVEEDFKIKQEIRNDSNCVEILMDYSLPDTKRKIKTEKRKPGGNLWENKLTTETAPKEETSQEGERRRSRRLPMRKDEVCKSNTTKDEPDDEQPKGRDFDLIQIRSELKGIEKAVKLSAEPTNKTDVTQDVETKEGDCINSSTSTKDVTEIKIKQEEEPPPVKEIDLLADDIYEFKEPEPFEFEVRQKCSDEKVGKLQRRPFGRICDELSKNTVPVRRKIIKPKPQIQSPPEGKKRFRSFSKKKEESANTESKPDSDSKSIPVSSLPAITSTADDVSTAVPTVITVSAPIAAPTLPTPIPSSAPLTATVFKSNTSSDIITCLSPKPLQLFEDIPEKQAKEHSISICEKSLMAHEMPKLEKPYSDISEQAESDSEDRLVISEMEDTEIEAEKVTDLLSTLPKDDVQPVSKFPISTITGTTKVVTSATPVMIVATLHSSELLMRSTPPQASSNVNEPPTSSKEHVDVIEDGAVNKGSKETVIIKKEENIVIKEAEEDEEEELEDDAISAAIQRVILQSMTDDESNDVDIIFPSLGPTAKPSPKHSSVSQSVSISPQLVHSVSSYSQSPSRKESSRRRKTSKTMLSKEFIDDSSSDSDDHNSIEMKMLTSFNRSPIIQSHAYSSKDDQRIPNQKLEDKVLTHPVTLTSTSVILPVSNSKMDEFIKSSQKDICHQVSSSPTVISVSSPSHVSISSLSLSSFKDSLINLTTKPAVTIASTSDKILFDSGCDRKDTKNESIQVKEVCDTVKVNKEDQAKPDDLLKKEEDKVKAEDNDTEEENTIVNEVACVDIDSNDKDDECDDIEDSKHESVVTSIILDSSSTSVTIDQKADGKQSVIMEVNIKEENDKTNTEEEKTASAEAPEEIEKVKQEVKDKKLEDNIELISIKQEEYQLQQMKDEEPKQTNCDENQKNDIGFGDSSEELAVEVDEESINDGNFGDQENLPEDKDKEKEQSSSSERSDVEDEDTILQENLPEIKEEEEECVQSLLCEETIPGSPAPVTIKDKEQDAADNVLPLNPNSAAELPFASAPGSSLHTGAPAYTKAVIAPQPIQSPVYPPPEAAPVMDNTPPTTPESSLSPISNSPRGERSGSSPGLDNESSKSHRDSSEIDLDSFPDHNKIGNYSEEDTLSNINMPGATILKKQTPANNRLETDSSPCKKRRRSRKRSEDANKRIKLARRSPRNIAGSDSDDTSENSLVGSSLDLPSSRSPKPSKYNFFVPLGPELDGAQRISVLQQKLQDLRKTYMSLKTELACIDRRRKKLRRREREEKSSKQEVPCS